MLQKSSREVLQGLWAGVVLVALCISLDPQSAAASGNQRRLGKPVPHHHHLYAMYHRPFAARPASLPYGPEYGFLTHVPANAFRGPVTPLRQVSGFWASRATCRLVHARTSIAMFNS